MKAQTRFKAVGSIAKLSTMFINNNLNNNSQSREDDEVSEENEDQ